MTSIFNRFLEAIKVQDFVKLSAMVMSCRVNREKN